MLKLFFDLKHQNITLTNPGVTVASDSKNYLVAKFNAISDDWETPLSAIFVSTVDKVAYTVLVGQSANLEADECYVPWEVLKDSGEVYVSVFSGNLHTTNVAKFAVVKSGYVEGEIPPPPTPTVYEQILEELANKQDVIYIDNTVNAQYNPDGHYILYYYDAQDIRHNIFDFNVFPQGISESRVYEILDATLQGDPNIAPSLYVAANQSGSYSLVYMDSDDQEHVIFDFSNLPSGSSNYEDLSNKPSINGVTLSGNKTDGDLGLQKSITVPTPSPSAYDQNIYLWLRNNGELSFNSQFVFTSQYTLPKISYWSSLSGFTDVTTDLIQQEGFTVGANGNIPINENGLYSRFISDSQRRIENYLTNSGTLYQKITVLSGGNWVSGDWTPNQNPTVVSAVVNQNGTITFTDSDGNTFTTTGESVIGADGFSPIATVQQTTNGATVTITDKNGTTTANISNGADGQDYVLTQADKAEIAQMAVDLLPNADTVSY